MTSSTMLDRAPCMVWTYDAQGTLDFVNAKWLAYTGVRFAAARRADVWSRLMPLDQAERFRERLDVAFATGVGFAFEAGMCEVKNPGRFRPHAIRIDPVRADDGAMCAWFGSALDVSDRRRAERAEGALIASDVEYRRERARFTLVQQALMPPNLPSVAGLTFDAIYEPGASDENVGGDWYDAFRLLDGRVLLTIGDVAGSGLHAAVIMGVVRQIMRGIGQLHAEPALMLDAADRALRLEYPEALVTAWVGILDLVTRRLTYASAGHPPPLLVETDGTVRELDHRTLPIGIRQGHQGHASSIELLHGSMIWLYTDGLIEASHNIIDGIRRLHDIALRMVRRRVTRPARLVRRLVIGSDAPRDDVAILVATTDFTAAERGMTRSHFDSTDAEAAYAARHRFAASLTPEAYSPTDVANAELVFGELCGNVARHAPGRIDIVVDRSGIQTVLHVMDRGGGFRHLGRLPIDPLAEVGRGLFIVAAMTTEFTVASRHGGGSHARAVLVGRYPVSLFANVTLPSAADQVLATL